MSVLKELSSLESREATTAKLLQVTKMIPYQTAPVKPRPRPLLGRVPDCCGAGCKSEVQGGVARLSLVAAPPRIGTIIIIFYRGLLF